MTKKSKESFSNYLGKALQNSMLTGIPQIAAAGNWPKKIVRTFVFIACFSGFIYQSLSFMRMYWKFETVEDIQIFNPRKVHKPSVTVCSEMGINVADFCADPEGESIRRASPMKCLKYGPSELPPRICDCAPRLCINGGSVKNLTLLDDEGYQAMYKLPRKDIQKWMLHRRDLMIACFDIRMRPGERLLACEDFYTIELPCAYFGNYPEACITMNSLIGRGNTTFKEVNPDAEMSYHLRNQDNHFPLDVTEPKFYISIHNPYTVLNPFSDGFMMESDTDYVFHIKKVIKNLLPYPYETDCIDYLKLWKEKGGRGPTNLKDCILECQRNISMERHGCLLRHIFITGYDVRCGKEVTDETLFHDASVCAAEKCKPACYEEYYIISKDARRENVVDCYMDYHKARQSGMYAHVKFGGMETTVYTFSPKYAKIETFSYLGGYVGMWLGISLVAVFDFVETVILMMKYPFRRINYYRAKRNQVGSIERTRECY